MNKTLAPLVILVFLKCSVGDCGEPPKKMRKRLTCFYHGGLKTFVDPRVHLASGSNIKYQLFLKL